MTEFNGRVADHPIERIFLERWSPRALDGSTMDEATLMSILEAARWAPSSYNSQPWRYIYALRETPSWDRLFGLLVEGNQGWARDASVLIIAVSKSTMVARGTEMYSHSHSFDAGASWQNMALQATALGWHAHAMVGFDMARAASELNIPEGYRVESAIAIGRRGDPAKEQPNGRNPVSSFAFEGSFQG